VSDRLCRPTEWFGNDLNLQSQAFSLRIREIQPQKFEISFDILTLQTFAISFGDCRLFSLQIADDFPVVV